MPHGTIWSSRCRCAGGVAIAGKGADQLKALDQNFSRRKCFDSGMFSSEGANRILEGLVGGGVLFTGSAVFDVGSFYWIAATGWFNGCGNDLWRI